MVPWWCWVLEWGRDGAPGGLRRALAFSLPSPHLTHFASCPFRFPVSRPYYLQLSSSSLNHFSCGRKWRLQGAADQPGRFGAWRCCAHLGDDHLRWRGEATPEAEGRTGHPRGTQEAPKKRDGTNGREHHLVATHTQHGLCSLAHLAERGCDQGQAFPPLTTGVPWWTTPMDRCRRTQRCIISTLQGIGRVWAASGLQLGGIRVRGEVGSESVTSRVRLSPSRRASLTNEAALPPNSLCLSIESLYTIEAADAVLVPCSTRSSA